MQKENMPKGYEPKEVEEKWYKYWEESGLFRAEAKSDRKPFCIVIPPPNVTGSLHMGHALNNTLQDILCRFKKMQGYNVLWQPGTDHAGIATQNVVERELAAKGTDRHQVGREKFIELVWEWREKYGGVIINQLKRLGSSCDWSRERFTMIPHTGLIPLPHTLPNMLPKYPGQMDYPACERYTCGAVGARYGGI